jgi:putative transcriptional regulator
MLVRFKYDRSRPPQLTEAEAARLDAMTDREIDEAAESDPDNPPLNDAELARLESAAAVRRVRAAAGLSQSAFAAAYRINVARLRDLEQGRTQADTALLAYLKVIAREPDAVRRALGAPAGISLL